MLPMLSCARTFHNYIVENHSALELDQAEGMPLVQAAVKTKKGVTITRNAFFATAKFW
jgi:hypothetical protein